MLSVARLQAWRRCWSWLAISYTQLAQFVPTSGTLIIGFLIPRRRENEEEGRRAGRGGRGEEARDVQITEKRQIAWVRAPAANTGPPTGMARKSYR